jgi:hypothetical protein
MLPLQIFFSSSKAIPETDNFGIEKVVCKVNQILYEKGYVEIDLLEVESRMKRTGMH